MGFESAGGEGVMRHGGVREYELNTVPYSDMPRNMHEFAYATVSTCNRVDHPSVPAGFKVYETVYFTEKKNPCYFGGPSKFSGPRPGPRGPFR